MKRIAFALLCLALLPGVPANAQEGAPGSSALPDRFAFDYSLHFSFDLDTLSMNADLNGSGAVDRAGPAFAVSLDGSMTLGTAQTIPVSEQLRWLDDTLYLNTGDGWQARGGAGQFAADLVTTYAFVPADAAALSGWDMFGIEGLADLLAALTPADSSAFLAAQRLDDEVVGDAQTAHYETTLDLHALMQSDAFVDALAALANIQGTMLLIYDHDELASIIRANSAMFEGASLTLDQYVGLDDGWLHRVTLALDMPIDPEKGGYADAPFTASALLDISLRQTNEPQSISVPDGAESITDFRFPAPPDAAPAGEGMNQYVFFGYIGDNETLEWSFEAKAGDTVTITTSGLSLEADTMVTLLAPDGTTLAENDDRETPSFALGDYESQITDYAITEDGTYSVQVIDTYETGSYVLTINIQR